MAYLKDGLTYHPESPELEPIRVTAASPLPVTFSGAPPVSGAMEITNDVGNPIPISGTVAVKSTFTAS